MRDFFHNSAVYLLDSRLAVDDDVVEFLGQNADNVLKIRVDFAVATCAFRATYGDKRIAVFFNHSVKNAEARFVEKFDCRARVAVLNVLDYAFSYIVNCGFHFNAKRGGKTYRRVCVYCQNTFVGEVFHQRTHDGCGK